MSNTNGRALGNVAAVARYPVKSMQGEALDVGEVTSTGLEGDRGWGVVHTETGHVLTAKRIGALLDAHARLTPDGPEIELPDGTLLAGPGSATDAALRDWLGAPVSLRPAGDTATSFTMSFNVDDQDVDTFDWSTPAGTFVDLAPIHLLTTTSLAAAAAAYPEGGWSVHRFRPTILVETATTAADFVENEWVGRSVAIGGVVLDITMPTIRCALPTKAQAGHGLPRDLQIFKTLSAANNQNLGAYATVRTPGPVRVGDPVTMLGS